MGAIWQKLAALGVAIITICLLAVSDPRPIVFESRESRTAAGLPVFNRLQWQWQPFSQETWWMQQSHQGSRAPLHLWDNLQIKMLSANGVITARFAELEPTATIAVATPAIPLKVACYRCHANGPRAIRPNGKSQEAPLNYWQRFRIFLMNLRIATYGPVVGASASPGPQPFQHQHPAAQKLMPLQSCAPCHNQQGGFSRSPLRYQHIKTAAFMVKNGLMPPLGFALQAEDCQTLGIEPCSGLESSWNQ